MIDGIRPSRLPSRERVQDVDRPAHVQGLAQPARGRRPRVEAKPLRLVPITEGLDGIGRDRSGRRHLGQELPVRTAEAKLTVGSSIHLVALLVHCAVVPATEQREVRERGGAALRPVAEVMPLTEGEAAAGKAAAAVSMVERPSQRWRDGPGASANFDDPAIRSVPHHHPGRVARQTLGRFRGNARAVVEEGGVHPWSETWAEDVSAETSTVPTSPPFARLC